MFGLKSLIFSERSGFTSSYSDKLCLIRDALGLGFGIVGISLAISILLSLDPLYMVVLIFVITFFVGRIFSTFTQTESETKISKDEKITDDEIKSMLKDRGLDKLINDKDLEDENISE